MLPLGSTSMVVGTSSKARPNLEKFLSAAAAAAVASITLAFNGRAVKVRKLQYYNIITFNIICTGIILCYERTTIIRYDAI